MDGQNHCPASCTGIGCRAVLIPDLTNAVGVGLDQKFVFNFATPRRKTGGDVGLQLLCNTQD